MPTVTPKRGRPASLQGWTFIETPQFTFETRRSDGPSSTGPTDYTAIFDGGESIIVGPVVYVPVGFRELNPDEDTMAGAYQGDGYSVKFADLRLSRVAYWTECCGIRPGDQYCSDGMLFITNAPAPGDGDLPWRVKIPCKLP